MKPDEQYHNRTYKVRCPHYAHAIYFTIVRSTEGKVLGMFINCKDMRHFHWATALMTAYTRLLRSGTPVGTVVGDMAATFDPNGPYVVPKGNGLRVNSIVHHFGVLLQRDEHSAGAGL